MARHSGRVTAGGYVAAILSGVGRKRLAGALGIAILVCAFAAASIVMGDGLWMLAEPTAAIEPLLPARSAPPLESAGMRGQTEEADEPGGENKPEGEPADRVWVSAGGTRYHRTQTCSGMKDAQSVGLAQAKAGGYTPCGRCGPPQ